jgi:hypothetical protein
MDLIKKEKIILLLLILLLVFSIGCEQKDDKDGILKPQYVK